MPRLSSPPPDDFRRVLREKALNHKLFYLKLSGECDAPPLRRDDGVASDGAHALNGRRRAAASARVASLVRRFEPTTPTMQYLRPPRTASPVSDESGDICSSDDDDRAAVRRRSRDLSDDSAVELEPRPRRHSHPRPITPPPEPESPLPRKELTLVEAQFIEIGERRGSEGSETTRGRCVRTPSVVVSDYSEDICAGATPEEAAWLRARALSADSACSSCSTLSSREDDELDSPPPLLLSKKMTAA